jgi:6-oxocyclohex-1-ene-carbonyl-CoA hydrolase
MSDLNWLPRESGSKDHFLWGDEHFSSAAPGVMFEKKPIRDPQGKPVDGLHSAWITLNNPKQYNSYTTEMVKGVIAGFQRASADHSVVAAIFTAVGDRAFCTGGNTKEYAEYYAGRPNEYGVYMDLFNAMVDSILTCKKPTICRVNGMRVAGGQEIGMACDTTLASDLAIFGQAGPRHGSAPDGGSSDFLPWMLPMEMAMWNCVSCEMWSAYKMQRLGLISKCVPVIKQEGGWLRNPAVTTDAYVADGEIVYGEFKTGEEARQARDLVKKRAHRFRTAGCRSRQNPVDVHQPFPRLSDQECRRHPPEKEILLGPGQGHQPPLVGGQHEQRSLSGIQRLQYQKDNRKRYHRLHRVPPTIGP